MSSFKFACPVCGQHITCDSTATGSPMDCPTCFRKLVVPSAPAADSPGFVLTAALVPSRPTAPLPQASTQATVAVVDPPKRPYGLVVFAALAIVALAAVTVWWIKQPPPNPHPVVVINPPAPIVTNRPPPAPRPPPPANWTTNLAGAEIPAAPVHGLIHGAEFRLERAVIQEGKLDLRQGPKWPPDLGVSIHLFATRPEDLAGKNVILESTRTNAPRMVLRWKEADGKAVNKDYRRGYAARIEFGGVTNNRLAGRIYLAAPDEFSSYVAGTFDAEIRRPDKKK
jgi:hypothetical protein